MGAFLAELKRRQMFRAAAAYAVVAWVLLQLVNNLTPALRLPEWAAALVVVLIVVGFPIALLFCWIQHLPADGAVRQKANRVDWILVSGLAAVVLLIAYQQIAPNVATTAQPSGVDASKAAANSPAGAISIAVLPFANLSGDANQEFFSDGMTEEITSALAKVPDLRVVARTSAYEFKGKNINIKTMGEQLGATHLIEGSVRKAGDRLRITAQLINAADGTHVWAQDYDRQLTDVFAIQEDIARAITASLHMSLGLKPGENLVNNRSIDSESYQQYLRARVLIQGRGGRAPYTEATALLEQIVARNPNYAPAWGALSAAYFFVANTDPAGITGNADDYRRVVDSYLSKTEAAARRAIQLDPNFPGGYGGLAIVELERGYFLPSTELVSKAVALDPDDPGHLFSRAINLAIPGDIEGAIALMKQLRAVEPFVPAYNRDTALYLWVDGKNDEAIQILNSLPPDTPTRLTDLARIYASLGRYGEAADLLEKAPPGNGGAERLRLAARLLRTAPAKADAVDSVPRLGGLDWVFLYVGAPERALENREFQLKSGLPGGGLMALIWHSSYAPVRKTERFKAYVRGLGLVDYWRAKGWPEFCHPTTGDDFVCA